MPYINTSNPCILMCASPGQTPVEKAVAIDGTPCSSNGVCVHGMCVVSCFNPVHMACLLHMTF